MRLGDQRESSNVEDMRGSGGGFGGGTVGIGALVIALIGGYVFGIDPSVILGLLEGNSVTQSRPDSGQPAPHPPANDQQAQFVARVLGSTEDAWTAVFTQAGSRYPPPKLVLFSGQ